MMAASVFEHQTRMLSLVPSPSCKGIVYQHFFGAWNAGYEQHHCSASIDNPGYLCGHVSNSIKFYTL